MILPCPLCQAKFAVPEDRIKEKGTRIQCPKCHFTFVMKAGEEPTSQLKPSTDTDPAIDPALAQQVKAQAAAAAGGEPAGDADTTDAEIDPALANQVRKEAEAHGYGPAPSSAPGPAADSSASRSSAQETDGAIEVDLEEVDTEVTGLSAAEVADLEAEEIVDADDLAQVAEQSGETVAEKSASPKAEAEAAGQWPSIIVDDGLANAPSEEKPQQKSSESAPEKAQSAVPAGQVQPPQQPAPASRQTENTPAQNAAAQVKEAAAHVKELRHANPTDVASAQAELQAALVELEAAQARLQAAQQAAAGAGAAGQPGSVAPAAQQGVTPSSVAETFVIPGRKEAPARTSRAQETPDLDDLADDDDIEIRGKSNAWVFVVILVVVGLALGGGAFYFKGVREEEKKAREALKKKKALEHPKDPRWTHLKVGAPTRRTLERSGSRPLLVVTTKARNDSKKWRYDKVTLEAELKSPDGKTLDSAWCRCGVEIPDEKILEAVKIKGRDGYYTVLKEKAVKADDKGGDPLSDGEMVDCQLVFFNVPKDISAQDLKVDVDIDKAKTESIAVQ
jgi:predicted Zn finger-like uncharacterized protein